MTDSKPILVTDGGSERLGGVHDPIHGPEYPEIVCFCGSTRFKDEYRTENARLTLEGKIVLSVGFFHHSGDAPEGVSEVVEEFETSEEKAELDTLHLRKVELADRVHVINADGYVGESTEREIRHAYHTETPVTWLEPDKIPEELDRESRSSHTGVGQGEST